MDYSGLRFFITSCKNDFTQHPIYNETKSDGITIKDTKEIFDKYSNSIPSSSGRKNKSQHWKKDPVWKLAKKEKIKSGLDVVIVQLDDSFEQPILKIYENGNNDEKQSNTIRKLIIYKDEQKKETITSCI